jgi:Tol biopolymer transport system component
MDNKLSRKSITVVMLVPLIALLCYGAYYQIADPGEESATEFQIHQIEYSPGRWIAFSCSTNLWGRVDQVFTSNRYDGLYLYNLDNQQLLQITEDGAFGSLDWSPDGSWIAFMAAPKASTIDDLDYSLYLIRPDGTELKEITPFVRSRSLSWSSTGSEIALTDNANIYVVNPWDITTRQLTQDDISFMPAWSPNGSEIAFLKHDMEIVYSINSDGITERVLINEGDTKIAGITWSPEADRIAVAIRRVGGGQSIAIISLNQMSESPVEIVPHEGMNLDPVWSPDGSWIAFISNMHEPGTNSQLYIVRPDGSGLQQLTDMPCWVGSPTWYPFNINI